VTAAFANCTGLTNFSVDAANSVYSSLGGVLFDKAQTTLIQFPTGRGGSYAIPNGVTSIGDDAFYYVTSLRSVTIPNSVTNVGGWAFYNCTGLTNFSVDAANSVYSSLGGVLFNKAQTTLIEFPGGRGGSYAIPNSVTSIGDQAFYYCTSLTNVTIPNSVTSIGGDAFRFCTGLTSVTIGSSVTSIVTSAFWDCTSLTSVTFLGNAPSGGVAMFDDVAPGAKVYYYYGATGWGPTYGGLPTVMLGAPAPQVAAASAAVKPGGFAFTLNGVVHQTIVVEAGTNLVNWQSIWTNTLSTVSTNFVDPQWVNFPRRFYRLRSN
jgi:hypothetical protein